MPKENENKTVEASAEVKAAATTEIDVVADIRAKASAEVARISAIKTACNGNAEIEAKAIAEGWTAEKAQLETLLAARPTAPNVIVSKDTAVSGDVLEAAALMAGKVDDASLLKRHGEKTLEAANKKFHGRIGLQQLILEAAWANGCQIRHFREDMQAVMRAAFPQVNASFSTLSLPNILSNVANKFLLDGFMFTEQAWRKIAAIRNVSDFKAVTSYRLSGGFEYDEVGGDGELKHGKLGEDTFSNQAKTYGKMFSITRQSIINDDLGALTDVPKRIGRGAGLKLNKVFWLCFLDNASFFTAARGNYDDGSDTALGYDAITLAEVLFLNQTDPDGNPVAIAPRTLLVPPALKSAADTLMKSMEIRDNTANSKTPTQNIHVGKYDVASSVYLSNSTMSGYSTTGWYLLADPNDVPVIEVAFLNGKQEPTVESADADFNTLGIQMRGYHDFGVAKQEYRGGVKMKGTA